jgi:Inner membrane protein YgaP-like, transmembrane domain
MQKNVGSADRILRVVIGLALLSLLVLRDDSLRWYGLIGLVPLLTASMSWCPLYSLLGIKTCPAGVGK